MVEDASCISFISSLGAKCLSCWGFLLTVFRFLLLVYSALSWCSFFGWVWCCAPHVALVLYVFVERRNSPNFHPQNTRIYSSFYDISLHGGHQQLRRTSLFFLACKIGSRLWSKILIIQNKILLYNKMSTPPFRTRSSSSLMWYRAPLVFLCSSWKLNQVNLELQQQMDIKAEQAKHIQQLEEQIITNIERREKERKSTSWSMLWGNALTKRINMDLRHLLNDHKR